MRGSPGYGYGFVRELVGRKLYVCRICCMVLAVTQQAHALNPLLACLLWLPAFQP